MTAARQAPELEQVTAAIMLNARAIGRFRWWPISASQRW